MLKRTSAIILGLLAVLAIAPARDMTELRSDNSDRVPSSSLTRVIRIDVPNHDAVYSLGRELRLDIVDARATFIKAYADDAQIERIRARGFPVTVLFDDIRAPEAGVFVLHHTYAQACSILVAATQAYPGITHLDTIGYSFNNHAIPAIKITSNPGTPADKPVVRILGLHHGNETQGMEICLSLVQFLTSGYGVNPKATELVDGREIWVIPIFNPDGLISQSRGNGNGTDLNRDYGYEWDNETGNGAPFSEPETRALNAFSAEHIPTIEYNYHTTAAYVNYLWDNTPVDPYDSALCIDISQQYVDSTLGSPTTELEAINGWDWYEVHGSCQDNTFGAFGGLATTIETALPNTWARIDSISIANRRALTAMMTRAGWGIKGLVYDSLTAQPLFAHVEFETPRRWHTYTNLPVGDFHKMTEPGTYSVRVSSNGYTSKTIESVVVPETGAVALSFPLARPVTEPLNYAQRIVVTRRYDPSHTQSGVAPNALGAPDARLYPLGTNASSYIIFDLDPYVPARNRAGADITITANGTYTVGASNNWQGPWATLGSGSGTQDFDLANVSMDSCRYLKITNTSSCALDGVSYTGSLGTGVSELSPSPLGPMLSVRPNPATSNSRVTVEVNSGGLPVHVSLNDVTGRIIRSFDIGYSSFAISGLASGIYYCRVEQGGRSATAKIVVQR